MGEEFGKKYDLHTLLKQKDLDINGVVSKNGALLAEEYFNTLTNFLDAAPMLENSLTQIAKLDGNEADFQNIAAMADILTGIGSPKLSADMDVILDAVKNSDKLLAALHASRIEAEFGNLCKRTMTALKTGRDNAGAAAADAEDRGRTTLKTVLERLEQEESTRKLRILAVDDASFMLRTISTILSDQYEVFSLTKGALVERFLWHTTPELFLLDYTMPDINGFELVPIIRSFEEHENTPIIFLTAMGTSFHVTAAATLGACDFIVKPVNADILREKIAKHIVRKKAF